MEAMKKNLFWGGLAIGAGIFLGALVLACELGSFQESKRTVVVKGLSEREVPADRVIWPIVFKEASNNLADIYQQVETKNKVIIQFLQENGIPQEAISVSPASLIDNQAERYGPQNVTYRYNITSVITVSSDQVDKVRSLISKSAELIKKGIPLSGAEDYKYNISYLFNGLNNIKPEMIEEATTNARASAEKFAQDSQSTLGKIKSASQGQISVSDRDPNTPYIKTLRAVTTIEYFLKN